jgi:hypothetical protein
LAFKKGSDRIKALIFKRRWFVYKPFIFIIIVTLALAGVAYSAAINFSAPLVDATKTTLGENLKVEMTKTAIEEMRAKMNAWAVFSEYSARSGR